MHVPPFFWALVVLFESVAKVKQRQLAAIELEVIQYALVHNPATAADNGFDCEVLGTLGRDDNLVVCAEGIG